MLRRNRPLLSSLIVITGVLSAILYISCSNEDHCSPELEKGTLRLAYDWNRLEPASGMRVLLYAPSAGIYLDTVVSSNGADLSLTPDYYRLLSFSSMENAGFKGMEDYNTAAVTFKEFPEIYNGSPSGQAGMLCSVGLDEFSVNAGETTDRLLDVYRLMKPIRLIIRTDRIEDIISCRGYLTGIAQSVFLGTGKPVLQDTGTVEFNALKTNDINFHTTLNVLGIVSEASNILSLKFIQFNQQIKTIQIDLTEILRALDDDGMTIVLIITSSGDTGLTAAVSNWGSGIGFGEAD